MIQTSISYQPFTQQRIADFQKRETPFYFYDMALLDNTLAALRRSSSKHDFTVHYALKANVNEELLRKIKAAGLGADCVSGNEIRQALACGFSGKDVVFAGVGKSDREIRFGLEHDIYCFNCESLQELTVLQELAAEMNKTARVALRVNPNIDAKTHRYITTGLRDNKFGINPRDFEKIASLLQDSPNLVLRGLHFHIGSQVTDIDVYAGLCERVNDLQQWFTDRGIDLPDLNLGGGLGINYKEPDRYPIADFESYFSTIAQHLKRLPGQHVHFELGRSIVGQCGSLISRALYIKEGVETTFAVLDAGMTELIRPALYQSHHYIENLSSDLPEQTYDIVGPICESSDCFGRDVQLAEIRRGDLIAIRSAGAYGQVMASRYNLRDLAESVYGKRENLVTNEK